MQMNKPSWTILLFAALAACLALADTAHAADVPAKQLFGAKKTPANLAARSVGSYAKGCLAGGKELPVDGAYHQVMRLTRHRNWGHPALVAFVEELAEKAHQRAGWPGLLIGDMAQPRGGPMLTGHASHQIGLDADIWLNPSPDRKLSDQEREDLSAKSVLTKDMRKIDRSVWTPQHLEVIKAAASDPRVARIFVHPVIKKELCDSAGKDRAWLRQIRPWWGHHYHFHVRLSCPKGSNGCENQAAPPAGDGCGKAMEWWLSDAFFKPRPKPTKLKPELKLADLPKACTQILNAD